MNKIEEYEFVEDCIKTIEKVYYMILNDEIESEVEGTDEYKKGRKDGYLSALHYIIKAFERMKKFELSN
jgi:hypothetical protein